MLVLSRKRNEKIKIGDNIFITVVDIIGDRVRLGVDAPKTVQIVRAEIAKEWRKREKHKNDGLERPPA